MVDLSWNGLQLLCHVHLCVCDVLKSYALQGNLQPGEQKEDAGYQI